MHPPGSSPVLAKGLQMPLEEMTMLITVSSSIQPAPIHHHHLSPPPTLPKPGKDNLRLQRLLKKAAKKNAVFASEQTKSFRSSLSPVNEASPDQEEYDESTPPAETPETRAPPSTSLPTHISIRPVNHRAPSPFRKSKPFTLKVTEQRRIAEHVLLTTSSAMPLLHKPEAPHTTQQPEDTGSRLPSPCDPLISVAPQPPPSSKERAPEVTYVTKVNTYFHSVKPPRAKTPISNLTQGTVSNEDTRPSSPAPQTSCSEPSPEHIPTSLDNSKATLPLLEPPLLPAADTEPTDQAPKPDPIEESIKAPSPKPSTSDAHVNMPTTHGSDTKISGSETAPELPKEDRNILKQSRSSTPWRQARPATATPVPADGTGSTSIDTKAEHTIQTELTPSLSSPSLPLKAEPAPSSVEAARPAGTGASGWHRLRKHLMVQPEAPSFPEPKPEKLEQEEGSKEDTAQAVMSQDCMLLKSRAMKMWDAILYQVTVNKETKQQAEEKKPRKEESFFLPRRLPILLHKPRFDARKLKELATKPMTKFSTVFEVSRFRHKSAEEHTKSFNRTASGWSAK